MTELSNIGASNETQQPDAVLKAAKDALNACVQFADAIARACDVDMDGTYFAISVMPEGREIGRKSWAKVQDDARAVLARIDLSLAGEAV